MSQVIADVTTIESIFPHPNPEVERLEIARAFGFDCIVPKGKYKIGDVVLYVGPNMQLPVTVSDAWGVTKYLGRNGRVKAIRLKGAVSQGLLVDPPTGVSVGDNVAEMLGITKYEPPPEGVSRKTGKFSNALPDLPEFRKYCDIENLRRFNRLFQPEDVVCVTEKIHGCLGNLTAIHMSDGTIKPIQSVMVGDMVMSFNHRTGDFEPKRVTNKFVRSPALKWMELRLSNGSTLVCTTDHKIATDRGYIAAENLSPTDELLSPNGRVSLSEKVYISQVYSRYDLEVEDNSNFIAEGILVHNSSARVGLVNGNLEVGSRNHRRRMPTKETASFWNKVFKFLRIKKRFVEPDELKIKNDWFWHPYSHEGVRNFIAALQDESFIVKMQLNSGLSPEEFAATKLSTYLKYSISNSIILFGETHGLGVQTMTYGRDSLDFAAYDIAVDGEFVDYEEFREICRTFSIPMVPLDYIGVFDIDVVHAYANQKSTASTVPQFREGVVVKTLAGGPSRKISKYISDDYIVGLTDGKVSDQDDKAWLDQSEPIPN